jgi:hypothetical protein
MLPTFVFHGIIVVSLTCTSISLLGFYLSVDKKVIDYKNNNFRLCWYGSKASSLAFAVVGSTLPPLFGIEA